MKISTVRESRDHASSLLRSKDPILVTRWTPALRSKLTVGQPRQAGIEGLE
jgi:hypothetical protein